MASDWAASFSANKREHHGTLASTGYRPTGTDIAIPPRLLELEIFSPG
jgi:hypothetical protein